MELIKSDVVDIIAPRIIKWWNGEYKKPPIFPIEINRADIEHIYHNYLHIHTSPPETKVQFALLHGSSRIREIAKLGAELYMAEKSDCFLALGGQNRNDPTIIEGIAIKNELLDNIRKLGGGEKLQNELSDKILIDAESKNTPENAIQAKNLITLQMSRPTKDGSTLSIKSLIVVAASFHARRAVMTNKRHLSNGLPTYDYYIYTYTPENLICKDDPSHLSKDGIAEVMHEYLRTLAYLERGDITQVYRHTSIDGKVVYR